ncbi:MAG: YjjG family noncanonical pyrimidine nucleotidase [Bacteroidetes bacterium]|nr:YjjG family noncanonical pyrimidine nucleotidase [Bacteroidota bacterium]
MQKVYKHIFFDLDRTLWDFEATAREAFHDIYTRFKLKEIGVENVVSFKDHYNHHNEILWTQYREGKLTKDILRGLRFKLTLREFGIEDDKLAQQIGQHYVQISPLLVNLFPNTHEIMAYLHPKYQLHIITNGFSEVQFVKLKESDLRKYFNKVITSEKAGVKKPDAKIFEYALEQTNAKIDESIMIGDDPEVDILGAKNMGMDQVLFDPYGTLLQNGATYYINDLIELKKYL